MKVVLLNDRLDYPKPKTAGSAGIDLQACIEFPITIRPQQTIKIPSGMMIELPTGWVGKMHPRSSTGVKGLVLANSTGVIDSDFRDEISIPVYNRSNSTMIVEPFQRIAQLVVTPHYDYSQIAVTQELSKTQRGTGGFGSTGK